MNCPKCGSSVGKHDEYCGGCGYHLQGANVNGNTRTVKKKNKKTDFLIFAVILEFAVVIVITAVLLFGFSNKDDEEVDSSENNEEMEESDEETDTQAERAEIVYDSQGNIVPEAYLIDDSDKLNEVKASYSKISQNNLSSSYASSTINQGSEVNNDPIMVFDGDDKTNWQEGVSGAGVGEYIEFTFDKTYTVKYMTFKLGNWKTDEYYKKNHIPKTLLIESGGNNWLLTFENEKQEFLVKMDTETEMSDIRITIQDIYNENSEWDDTPITDIGLWYK